MHKQIGATLQLAIIYAVKEITSYDIQMQRGNRKRQTIASLDGKGRKGKAKKNNFGVHLACYTVNSVCRTYTGATKANVASFP